MVFGSGPDAASNPATISVAILQTGELFNTDDFDKVYVDENQMIEVRKALMMMKPIRMCLMWRIVREQEI